MVVLSAIFVAARVTQRVLKRSLGVDDFIIIMSLVASVVLSATEIEAVRNGYGAHYHDIPKDRAVVARKWFYGAQIAYKVVLMLNKLSICSMYYRIFQVTSPGFRLACRVVQGIIVSSGIAFVTGTIFQCTPVRAFWDKTVENPWCISQTPWWTTYAVLQILLDLVLLFLPIRQVLQLHMSRPEKLGLYLVFCTGLFVTFTSIFRATTLAASATNPDPTWGPIPATVWTVIEANSGIIAACLPLLRQPFVWVYHRLIHNISATSRTGHSVQARAVTQDFNAFRNRHSRGDFRSATHTTAIAPQPRESEEHIVGKDHNIYVMRDVSVSSTIGTDNCTTYIRE